MIKLQVARRYMDGRRWHSSPFRPALSFFHGMNWVIEVTRTGHVKLNSGRL